MSQILFFLYIYSTLFTKHNGSTQTMKVYDYCQIDLFHHVKLRITKQPSEPHIKCRCKKTMIIVVYTHIIH